MILYLGFFPTSAGQTVFCGTKYVLQYFLQLVLQDFVKKNSKIPFMPNNLIKKE